MTTARTLELAGPKGYVHNWHYVGGPGLPSVDPHLSRGKGKSRRGVVRTESLARPKVKAPAVRTEPKAKAPRKPSRTYMEYQAAKQEQARRFENSRDGGGYTDGLIAGAAAKQKRAALKPAKPPETMSARELKSATGPAAEAERQRRATAKAAGSPRRGLNDYGTRHDNPTRLQQQDAGSALRLQQNREAHPVGKRVSFKEGPGPLHHGTVVAHSDSGVRVQRDEGGVVKRDAGDLGASRLTAPDAAKGLADVQSRLDGLAGLKARSDRAFAMSRSARTPQEHADAAKVHAELARDGASLAPGAAAAHARVARSHQTQLARGMGAESAAAPSPARPRHMQVVGGTHTERQKADAVRATVDKSGQVTHADGTPLGTVQNYGGKGATPGSRGWAAVHPNGDHHPVVLDTRAQAVGALVQRHEYRLQHGSSADGQSAEQYATASHQAWQAAQEKRNTANANTPNADVPLHPANAAKVRSMSDAEIRDAVRTGSLRGKMGDAVSAEFARRGLGANAGHSTSGPAADKLAVMTAVDHGQTLTGHPEAALREVSNGRGKYASHARDELARRHGDGSGGAGQRAAAALQAAHTASGVGSSNPATHAGQVNLQGLAHQATRMSKKDLQKELAAGGIRAQVARAELTRREAKRAEKATGRVVSGTDRNLRG